MSLSPDGTGGNVTTTVTLPLSGRSFDVPPGRDVLTAGLDAGINLPYSCRAGLCKTCKGRVLEGAYTQGRIYNALTEVERAAGFALLCQITPAEDMAIEIREIALESIPPKIVPCRVKKIAYPTPDIAVIDLKLPHNENMQFAAGQYIQVQAPDGRARNFSIATAPPSGGAVDIQIHVRHVPGGAFTDQVFTRMKERELLRFSAPHGTFVLRRDSDKPIIFLAGGTGIAPIKSMVEAAMASGIDRPMSVYWGCRTVSDLYIDETVRSWGKGLERFRYVPVLSRQGAVDGWHGRTGYVHQAVLDDYPDLGGYQVYASGSPAMVDAARQSFLRDRSLPAEEFFADAFLTEADRNMQPINDSQGNSYGR